MAAIDEQVINYFHALFARVFSTPFGPQIKQRLKRNAVIRQVEESADAASQSLTRLLLNQQLTEEQVAQILSGFDPLGELLREEEAWELRVTFPRHSNRSWPTALRSISLKRLCSTGWRRISDSSRFRRAVDCAN